MCFLESKKEILSQINKLQTDFANIKPTHTEPSGTKDDEKVREREKMREKEFSDLVSRVEKLQKEVNDGMFIILSFYHFII